MDKFTYLGRSLSSTETEINTWLGKAWTAFDSLSVIWKSDPTDKIKCSFFQAAVVSILLYGFTRWTLTKRMKKNLMATTHECCEQYWRSHPTKQQLHGHLPTTTKTIQIRRARHTVHGWRSKDEFRSDVLLRTTSHGRAKVRRPARTYVQQLCADTECSLEDLLGAMDDRDGLWERVRDIRAGSLTWWW